MRATYMLCGARESRFYELLQPFAMQGVVEPIAFDFLRYP
jgi:hypothetical protein